jgi:hypothetical protein
LSLDALQLSARPEDVTFEALRPVGEEGGVVSGAGSEQAAVRT